MATKDIPTAVCVVVGDEIGSHYYSHRRIESLFAQAGAPGDSPEGSCVDKSREWLRRASLDPHTDGLKVLGAVLEEFMEVEPSFQTEVWAARKARVEKILGWSSSAPSGRLIMILHKRSPPRAQCWSRCSRFTSRMKGSPCRPA
jgi:hypothetical protein